jgi:CO/xanthine dehydrogenase Mo-binding subunit
MPDGIGWAPALRAPGAPPAAVVMECLLDDLAAKLELDPLELRLKNVTERKQESMKPWFEEGAKRIGWERRQKKPGTDKAERVRGIGVGCGEFAGSSGCDFIEVEVDRGTGIVRVIKVAVMFEGGFLNRRAVLNQVKGGTIMGLSWALFEERILDPRTGAMLNPNFEFYKIAGPRDVPEIEVVLFGKPGRSGGVGEAPVVPVAGALSNAIFNALGVRVARMPFSPRNVLAALGG